LKAISAAAGKGDRGETGATATIVSWQVDRERVRVSPLMSTAPVGPMPEPGSLFEE